MSQLLSVSSKLLAQLYPRTLYEFGQRLTSIESIVKLAPVPELAELDENLECLANIKDEDLRCKFLTYRDTLANAIKAVDKHGVKTPKDNELVVLLHDLRKCSMDDQQEELAAMSLASFPYQHGWSNFEFAVRLLLNGKDAYIKAVAAKVARSRVRGFHYYSWVREKGLFKGGTEKMEPGAELEKLLQERTLPKLEETYNTKLCRVNTEVVNDNWYIEILHGGKREITQNEQGDQFDEILIQNAETDVVIYCPRTKDIRVCMEKRILDVERKYVAVLCNCLWSNEMRWALQQRFDLEKFRLTKEELIELQKDASDFLTNAMNSGVIPQEGVLRNMQANYESYCVVLVEVNYEKLCGYSGKKPIYQVLKKSCAEQGLVNTLSDGEPLIPEGYRFRSVVLSIRSSQSRPRIIVKSDTLGETENPAFEAWLEKCRISVIPEEEAAEDGDIDE